MDFLVLGPLEVHRDGLIVDVGGARQRAVLSRLLIARREVVGVDRLIDDLWNGEPTPSALGVLQAYVSHLRRALEPDRRPRTPATVLVSRTPGYALLVESDADRFATLVTRGIEELASADPRAAATSLDGAIALWRGDAYADVADEEWAQPEAARLGEMLLVAREHRHAAALSLGQAHASVPDLERLVVEHPLREGLWRLLALALYRTARQGDALDALRRARAILADELGLDPSPALRELESAILDQSESLGLSNTLTVLDPPRSIAHISLDPAVSEDVLVGRESSLTEVRAAAAEAAELSRPRSVVVIGSAGIGKSRLLDRVDMELRANSWTVASARCHETSGAPALWPWLQILADLDLTHPLPPDLADLVAGIVTEAPAPTSGDAGSARFRQHESIRRYLSSVARDRPLLICIDDVQWADSASLQLFGDLFTMSRTGQILGVAATRPSDRDEHVSTWVRLDRAGGRRVTLAGLTADDLEELARAAGHPVSGSLLLERTGGNPFFARETLRLMDSRGTRESLSVVPDSVGALLRQRLGQLPPEAQTVLQVAAALGRDVDIDLLVAVSDQAVEEIWDAIETGALIGVLVDAGDGDVHFAHDLVRETLYADIAPLRRMRVHARIVEVLAAGSLPDASQLAEHARSAGPAARPAAVTWSVAAAREAQGRLAHVDAARWWATAVDAQRRLPDADPGALVELLLSLLRSQLDSGDAIGARETRNEAILAADATGDVDLTTRSLVALDAPALWLLRHYDEVELDVISRLEALLTELPTGDDPLLCRVMCTLAAELYDGAQDPRCDTLSLAGLEMARRLGEPALVAFALNMRYLAVNRGAATDDRVAIGHELVKLGEGEAMPAFTLLGHQLLADALLGEFDVTGADHHARAADRLIARLDLALPRMQAIAGHAARLQLEGRFEEAATAHADFRRAQSSWWAMDPLFTTITVEHLLFADRVDDIDRDSLAVVAHVMPSVAHDLDLLLSAATGTPPTFPQDWATPPRDWAWPVMMSVRAHVAAKLAPPDIRRSTYDALAPYAGRIAVSSGIATPVAWHLGRLAESLGDTTAARRHYLALEEAGRRESIDWWADRAARAALALT